MSNVEEAPNSRHACAACKHQRRKCETDCLVALYFPVDNANSFQVVDKIFGIKNVTAILSSRSPDKRERAVESLEWEASAWKNDPVEGSQGLFMQVKRELKQLKKQQQQQQQQNTIIVPYSNHHTNSGLDWTLGTFVPNSNIHAAKIAYDIGMESCLPIFS